MNDVVETTVGDLTGNRRLVEEAVLSGAPIRAVLVTSAFLDRPEAGFLSRSPVPPETVPERHTDSMTPDSASVKTKLAMQVRMSSQAS